MPPETYYIRAEKKKVFVTQKKVNLLSWCSSGSLTSLPPARDCVELGEQHTEQIAPCSTSSPLMWGLTSKNSPPKKHLLQTTGLTREKSTMEKAASATNSYCAVFQYPYFLEYAQP